MTSADVALLLGVSPASIKRWADAGLLACVRTPGRHRRFRRGDVERLRDRQEEKPWAVEERSHRAGLLELLRSPVSPLLIADRLLQERASAGSWWRTASLIGEVLADLGELWRDGQLAVLDEHEASERLKRALARCAEAMPPRPGAPRALLASAEGDEHTLGLSLVELVLREHRVSVHWAGRGTPVEDIAARVATGTLGLVAISASAASRDAEALARQALTLESACAGRGVELLLGGDGAWPEGPSRARRVRGFDALERFLVEWLP